MIHHPKQDESQIRPQGNPNDSGFWRDALGSNKDGILPAEERMAALVKAKAKKETHSAIESHHPGFLGSQDACCVGMMKCVGRIYQQTFVATYARGTICQLYPHRQLEPRFRYRS